MNSVMIKTTLREIRQSLGRYIAILAIVALGVGFFAGLKAARPAMVGTTEEYFNELNFYDLRLISTLGFDDESIETFQEQKGVETAIGSYSFDIVCENSGEENSFVVKTHSITDGVNSLYLVAGRMPENDKECVVDAQIYSSKQLGQKVIFSAENDEEDLEHFKYREYTIVGVAQSPLYIQFERGNTSLGNGQISGALHLREGAYDSEAYTEAYIKFKEDYPLYSDAYKEFMEDKEEEWKLILKETAIKRADMIRDDAYEALEEAEAEFKVEKAKAEKELEDAKKQIDEGKKQLEDAKTEITAGWDELREQKKALSEGEKELNDNEALLLEKEAELNAGILTWQQNNNKVLESKTQLRMAEAEINSQENQLTTLEQVMGLLDSMILSVKEPLITEEAAIKEEEKALTERETALNTYEEQMKAQYGQEIPADIQEKIREERSEIQEEKDSLQRRKDSAETSKALLNTLTKQYDEYDAQIKDGRKQIEDAKKKVVKGWAELDKGEQELNKAWTDIVNGQAQIDAGKTQIAAARLEIASGKLQITEAEDTLEDGQKTLEEKEQELLDGEREYEEGLREFEEKIAEAEEELLDAQRKIKEIEDPDTYVLDRNTNVGYVCFENDSNIVEDIAKVFPVFFFMVAALVCMTTMNRMIEEQRTQIGVLKGLGYSEWIIMGKYLAYSGSAALIGCFIGFFAMTYIFPQVIWTCYGIMYDVKPAAYYFDIWMLLIGILVSLLCSVGTTWYCCRNELKEVAASLMRPKTPEAGKRIFLEKIDFIWSRLKFLQKVSIRNVFRYKKRFFMMIVGISGCTALIVAGLGVNDSIKDVTEQQYTEILKYDMSITFTDEITEDILEEFDKIVDGRASEYTVVMENSLDLKVDDITKPLNLIIFEDFTEISSYVDLHTVKDEKILFPGTGQVVINHKIADAYDLETGSEVVLLDEYQKELHAIISGVNQNFVLNYVFLNEDTYEQALDRPVEYKTIYLNVPKDGSVDQHLLSADIMKMYEVAAVSVNLDARERFVVMMSSLDYIVALLIVCAGALAFIVLYNLTNINITERVREIATIKVLGFYKNETSSYVFRENMMLTVIGALLGLLVGKFFHAFVMSCVQVDMIAFDVKVTPLSYVISVVLTYIFATFVNLMMRSKIEKINMTESLKSVD